MAGELNHDNSMVRPLRPSHHGSALALLDQNCAHVGMYEFPLTGAQKTYLRGLGQRLDPALKVGKAGVGAQFFTELQRLLNAHELVKIRFLGADRDERAALCDQIADEGRCVCAGAVGHTALFFRQQPSVEKRSIALPKTAEEV